MGNGRQGIPLAEVDLELLSERGADLLQRFHSRIAPPGVFELLVRLIGDVQLAGDFLLRPAVAEFPQAAGDLDVRQDGDVVIRLAAMGLRPGKVVAAFEIGFDGAIESLRGVRQRVGEGVAVGVDVGKFREGNQVGSALFGDLRGVSDHGRIPLISACLSIARTRPFGRSLLP